MKKQLFLGSRWFLGIASASAVLVAVSELSNTSINAQTESSTPPPAAAEPVQAEKLETLPVLSPEEQDKLDKGLDTAASAPRSAGMTEVIKLAQAHVSEEVLLAYIRNADQPFNPSANDIIFLTDFGISQNVVTELINHKNAQPAAKAVVPPPAPPPAPSTSTVETAPPPQEVTVNYFYDSLAPYGTWVEVGEYGRCWRPTVVIGHPGWRPYGDHGRWVYTDCGWYWQSDYSWGWAPFHYGRWYNDIRFGWVWVPDTVWGPSWVCWRRTDAYCGWAPLPPHARFEVGVGLVFNHGHVGVGFDFGIHESWFTFVAYNRFCDPHPYRYYVPRTQVTTIYRNSTVINNYIVNNNNRTIINEGVGRDHIAAVTHKPVQKVALHDVSETKFSKTTVDRIDKSSRSLGVFRPNITATSAPLAPGTGTTKVNPAVHNTSSGTEVQHAAGHAPASHPVAPKFVDTPQSQSATTAPRSTPPAGGGSSSSHSHHQGGVERSQPSTSPGKPSVAPSKPQSAVEDHGKPQTASVNQVIPRESSPTVSTPSDVASPASVHSSAPAVSSAADASVHPVWPDESRATISHSAPVSRPSARSSVESSVHPSTARDYTTPKHGWAEASHAAETIRPSYPTEVSSARGLYSSEPRGSSSGAAHSSGTSVSPHMSSPSYSSHGASASSVAPAHAAPSHAAPSSYHSDRPSGGKGSKDSY